MPGLLRKPKASDRLVGSCDITISGVLDTPPAH